MATTVIAQQWISVDGRVAGPGGEGDLFAVVPPAAEAASQEANLALLETVDEVLLGRATWASFQAFWPEAQEAVAPAVNAVPKVVCSRTLDAAPWGHHAPAAVVRDAVEHVRRRRADDVRVLVWGSISVVQALVAAGELDELDLLVAPVVLGSGRPLLEPGTALGLRQVDVEVWEGVTRVRHRVVRPGAS